MGKHSKEKTKDNVKTGRLVNTILVAILIVMIIVVIVHIKNENCNKTEPYLLGKTQVDESENTNQGKSVAVRQLEALQRENEDIKAYIEIAGTNISYPVLQAGDNEYYMNNNYKKEKSKAGSIFLDKDVSLEQPSSNFLIYGHNMKDGSMFNNLLNYKDKNYYNEHNTIKFITNSQEAEYEIIAAFYSRVYYKSEKNVFRYYYFINAKNEQEFNDYVKNCKKESLYDTKTTAEYGDQLITLSTCSYHTEDGRFVVVAKKIK